MVEFENGKPLYDCGFFDEPECWELIRIMADTLGHAHKYGVKHGNLHPGNLFLLEHQYGTRQLRIGDFATGMMGQVHHVDLGETAYFAAPEQLLSLGADFEGGKAERWDVYRFGAVAFWLLNRMLPRARGYRRARAQNIANSGGRPVPIDPFQLAESALDEGKLSWGRGVARGKRSRGSGKSSSPASVSTRRIDRSI